MKKIYILLIALFLLNNVNAQDWAPLGSTWYYGQGFVMSNNISFVKKYCNALKKNTDILMPLMQKLQKKIPTLAEYKKFHSAFDRHLAFHVFN